MGVDDRFASLDAIVHLAAVPAPGLAPNAVIFENNITATYHVFAAARAAGIKRIVWASSETVLGLPMGPDNPPPYLPVDEEYHPRPELVLLAGQDAGRGDGAAVLPVGPGVDDDRPSVLQRHGRLRLRRLPVVRRDPALRQWNAWGYIDARDGAQAVRLALGARSSVGRSSSSPTPTPSCRGRRRTSRERCSPECRSARARASTRRCWPSTRPADCSATSRGTAGAITPDLGRPSPRAPTPRSEGWPHAGRDGLSGNGNRRTRAPRCRLRHGTVGGPWWYRCRDRHPCRPGHDRPADGPGCRGPGGPGSVAAPFVPTVEQLAVIRHRRGRLRVLAGPGTGKTTTIAASVAARIADGADPGSILVLTFARRAAADSLPGSQAWSRPPPSSRWSGPCTRSATRSCGPEPSPRRAAATDVGRGRNGPGRP